MLIWVRRRLQHTPSVAQRVNATSIAGLGDIVVMPIVALPRVSKAKDEHTVFQILQKRLTSYGLRRPEGALLFKMALVKQVNVRLLNIRL